MVNKINNSVDEFVKTSFNEHGSYNTDRVYPSVAGKNKKNCKYMRDAPNDVVVHTCYMMTISLHIICRKATY